MPSAPRSRFMIHIKEDHKTVIRSDANSKAGKEASHCGVTGGLHCSKLHR